MGIEALCQSEHLQELNWIITVFPFRLSVHPAAICITSTFNLLLTKTGGEHPFQFSTCSHEKDLMGNFRISYLVLFRQL